MQKLNTVRNRFKGKTLALIGAAPSTVDYDLLAEFGPDICVFVNWSIKIAPKFTRPQHELYFVTWHPEIFGLREDIDLDLSNLQMLLYPFHSHMVQPEILDRAIEHRPTNIRPWEAYEHMLNAYALNEQGMDWIDLHEELISHCNSTLIALMFLWYGGCRDIKCYGMHDIGGVPAFEYDPRLGADTEHIHSPAYMRDPEEFCRIMGVTYEYIGN